MKTDTKFIEWFEKCETLVNDHFDTTYPNLPLEDFTYKVNRKYVKVTKGTCVWAFVNRENGDVLKPASYKAPAKHARGNIYDDDGGMKYIGPYGPAYLR